MNGNGKLEKVVRCSTGMCAVYSLAAADSDYPRGSHVTIRGWLSVSTIVGVSLALCMC